MANTKVKKTPDAGALEKLNAAKAAKFIELAQKRATKAINAIRSLQRLSNKHNYISTPEQVTKICEALRLEVVAVNEAFNTKSAAVKEGFKL